MAEPGENKHDPRTHRRQNNGVPVPDPGGHEPGEKQGNAVTGGGKKEKRPGLILCQAHIGQNGGHQGRNADPDGKVHEKNGGEKKQRQICGTGSVCIYVSGHSVKLSQIFSIGQQLVLRWHNLEKKIESIPSFQKNRATRTGDDTTMATGESIIRHDAAVFTFKDVPQRPYATAKPSHMPGHGPPGMWRTDCC
jgi:hypothetical protein